MKFIEAMNERVDSSFIGKFFQIKERGSSFSTELAGATATFLTMAYILAVNPRILADSGGPCVVDPDDPAGEFISPLRASCSYYIILVLT
jgi:adenine/guanine/hypoxanthine permease